MMKKTINKSLSFVVALLLCVLIPFNLVVYAADPVSVVITVGEALINTISLISDNMAQEPFNGDDYSRIVEFANGQSVKHDVDRSLGLTNVRISNYTYICGKYCMQTKDDNNEYRHYMAQVSMYYNDGFNTDNSDTMYTVEDASGNTYIANNIYFDIYRDDGTHKRFRYVCHDSLTMSQQFGTSTWGGYTGNLTNTGVTIHRTTNSSYYDVTSGDAIGTLMNWTPVNRDINLRFRDDNSIWIDANSNTVSPSYRASTIRWFRNDNGYDTLPLPSDQEICTGLIHAKSPNGSWTTTPSYTLGFYTTNSNDNKQIYERNFGSPKSNTFVYNYDDSFVGGTVVDNSNKTTVLDGTLNTAFDANGNVILPVDLDANIMPLINASLANIDAKVNGFFDDMPDFGNNWNNRNPDNNYFDLEFPIIPQPPDDNTIIVNVTVDITRPLVTTYHWEDPLTLDTLPEITTETLPVAVQEDIANFGQYYDIILDSTGLLPIFGFLALFGVAVALIFKGV